MSDEETIAVAETSHGPDGGAGTSGESVDLPVVEILTGRGFITGKSGSGKSNSASVVGTSKSESVSGTSAAMASDSTANSNAADCRWTTQACWRGSSTCSTPSRP